MNFFEFPEMKVSALAAAVPDNHQRNMELIGAFREEELKKFCESTGIWERYVSTGLGITGSDLCVAAANEIFKSLDIDKDSIDGLIFLSQTPDYLTPSTAYIIQHRLGLDNCGLVFDSNIGCTAFPFGIQLACANIMAGCRRVLLLVGDADPVRGWNGSVSKDSLLFGDCGIAAVIERADQAPPIRICLHSIGKGYKAIMMPYGGYRHPLAEFYRERGAEGMEAWAAANGAVLEGADVFSFSIIDGPKTTKKFFQHFGYTIDDYDLVSLHQANRMIVDNVAKRIKAPSEKLISSLEWYGNTRGSSTAVNICDYAMRENVFSGTKRILNVAFGIGLNVAVADFELDMSRCLPILKTKEAFEDEIDYYTYFS